MRLFKTSAFHILSLDYVVLTGCFKFIIWRVNNIDWFRLATHWVLSNVRWHKDIKNVTVLPGAASKKAWTETWWKIIQHILGHKHTTERHHSGGRTKSLRAVYQDGLESPPTPILQWDILNFYQYSQEKVWGMPFVCSLSDIHKA